MVFFFFCVCVCVCVCVFVVDIFIGAAHGDKKGKTEAFILSNPAGRGSRCWTPSQGGNLERTNIAHTAEERKANNAVVQLAEKLTANAKKKEKKKEKMCQR